MRALFLALALLLTACPPKRDADYPEGCRDADLARLSASYAAALVEACAAYDSLDECPMELREPVDARHDAAYQQWEACK